VADDSIAVVLATFNGDRYLNAQLVSIANQSRKPDELIIGDDGSTDDTLSVLDAFASTAPFPVHILRHQRIGVGDNFLSAVQSSQSDLVAFSDQDDVWHPRKLEISIAALGKLDADLVLHGAQPVDQQLRPIRTGYDNVRKVRIRNRLRGNVWYSGYGHAMVFRRDLLNGCDWKKRPRSQWSNTPMHHDDLVGLLATVKGRTVRIPDRLIQYRQHGRNVAGAPPTLLGAVRARKDPYSSVAHRVEVAEEWACYFSDLVSPHQRREVIEYFNNAARIMAVRAERLHDPRYKALPSLGLSALKGHYSSRTPDGVGWKRFLQDSLWFVVR